MQPLETSKVDIIAIDDVERPSIVAELIEDINFLNFASVGHDLQLKVCIANPAVCVELDRGLLWTSGTWHTGKERGTDRWLVK